MTRKRLLIIIGSLLLIGILWFAKYYFLDQSVVTFTVAGSAEQVDIYNKNNTIIASLTGSGNLRLEHGDYYAIPANHDYSDKHITFTSPSTRAVNIDPDYSEDRLASLAEEAKATIQELLVQKYPSLMSQYSLTSFTLYKKGQWGGGLLVRNDSTQNDTKDVYRFIVRDTEGWQIKQQPELILTQSQFNDVPTDVLLAIDTLTYSPLY